MADENRDELREYLHLNEQNEHHYRGYDHPSESFGPLARVNLFVGPTNSGKSRLTFRMGPTLTPA
jgi:hypothetical protein